MMTLKIISGGQTGADRGGLDAAIELHIEHGGFCPLGRRAEDGRIPAKYKLTECEYSTYPERTEMNVREADATLVFCLDIPSSRGSKLTTELCRRHGKVWVDVISETAMFEREEDAVEHVATLLRHAKVINVAGSRESMLPGAQRATRRRCAQIFARLLELQGKDVPNG